MGKLANHRCPNTGTWIRGCKKSCETEKGCMQAVGVTGKWLGRRCLKETATRGNDEDNLGHKGKQRHDHMTDTIKLRCSNQ